MIGSAIVSAMATALLLFFLFTLMSLGVLSTPVPIGLYRRSFSGGFRSFLLLVFGIPCVAIGGIGLALIDHFLDLPGSPALPAAR